jgi:hypothetical protein
MRARLRMMVWGMCVAGGSLFVVACGSKEKAKDPSDTPAYKDETPKWEGATNPTPSDDPKPKTSSGGSSSGGAINEAPKQRTDQYDKEATEMVLKRAARQVKDNCGAAKDDNGKAVGPWGKTTVQVALGHNGHSKGTTVPSPYQGKPTGNCVEKAFTNLTYPPWNGPDSQLDWEVELVEPGKEKAPEKK